jgi:hypothetical protein
MESRRIQEAASGGRWMIFTILDAMNVNGMVAAITVEQYAGYPTISLYPSCLLLTCPYSAALASRKCRA